MVKVFFAVIALGLYPAARAAQSPDIEQLAFLTGYWQGPGLGGHSEEMWMPPSDNRLLGLFKQSGANGLEFSEIVEIVAAPEGIVMHVKHFNADFTGWEEKDDFVSFPLLEVSANKAVFDGLVYELVTPNQLLVTLQIRQSDGTIEEVRFDLTRQILD